MPWIIIVPLGVMLIGMAIGFARQHSTAGRKRAAEQGAGGAGGTWLIFMGLIEIAMGLGSLEGARRADGPGGGFAIAGTILLAVGVVLLLIGIVLKLKALRRGRLYRDGLPGEAKILSVGETGVVVNHRPMYQFELEVTAAGSPTQHTTHRESIPYYFLNNFGPGATVPVKVDPGDPQRVVFDWDRITAAAVEPSAVTTGPPSGTISGYSPAGTHLSQPHAAISQLTGGAGRKIIGGISAAVILITLISVAGAAFIFSQVMKTVDRTADSVTDTIQDSLREGFGQGAGNSQQGGPATEFGTKVRAGRTDSEGNRVAFEATIPFTWTDVTGTLERKQDSVVVDLAMKPPPASLTKANILITRSMRYLERPADPGADVTSIAGALRRELKGRIKETKTIEVGGETALLYDLRPSGGLRARQVTVMREGQVFFIALTAPKLDFPTYAPQLQKVLNSWRWL